MHLEQLYSAYLGELYGIAFFSAFAQKYSDDSHIDKWQLLIQVEEITALKLETALQKHPISLNDRAEEMRNKGIGDAQKWMHLDWASLIDTLVPWVKPYALKYREQADAATAEREMFKLVQEHEDAIYDFLLAEQQQSGNSIDILKQFITKWR
ncbi:hypothetical protein C9I98_18190 [Photobacterium sanctipauli]|uniref:Uncharacterized protein n=1 Tax=Photobacterium sanctipauli TaxID=1342794 RepID=A0A2T3NPB3_9GAMM|nr:hypothetical protein [Photobacterium sanctipauli]PSW18114.1 hypothetical protein C9I98_18190 [Photobacterium sanctipauli]